MYTVLLCEFNRSKENQKKNERNRLGCEFVTEKLIWAKCQQFYNC